MRKFIPTFFFFLFLFAFAAHAQTTDVLLQQINAMNLAGLTITEIDDIPSGTFKAPNGEIKTHLPAFVRIAFTSKPTPESNIRIELWLPKDTWNGRFLGTGNGGGAGRINYSNLSSGIMQGFATANTDMGTSPNADQILDYPERWADFGYRSTNVMTVLSKAILEMYYQKSVQYSYFEGCSTGGEQALMEAQRFPEDYNGIIAGAPANNRTHLHTSFVWNLIATNQGKNTALISPKKMQLLSGLLLQKYRGTDGGAPGDNFLTDPRVCNFDPEMLPKCTESGNTDSCFSNEEIEVFKRLYAGTTNLRTGERIYAPLPMGGTSLDITPSASHSYLFKWVFGKDFDYTKFNFDTDMAKVDSILAPILNANNPDLSALKNRGGKLLMYMGTADQLVPYPDAINYYERVIEAQGGLRQTQDFFRFYLIPGMAHCGGGPGLNDMGSKLNIMLNWVEKGIAPDEIMATAFNCCDTINKVRLRRPVYPYPKFPAYRGGDPALPSSFSSIDHPRGGVLISDKKYLK
jgi:feruloyl esterase